VASWKVEPQQGAGAPAALPIEQVAAIVEPALPLRRAAEAEEAEADAPSPCLFGKGKKESGRRFSGRRALFPRGVF
jgi:hypothetical protein